MSDHNPSDSFDSHPENSGCSNDDFEQVDVPGSAFYHDNGDADGPDDGFVGSNDVYGFHYDQDEQGAEVSTTTRPTAGEEDEAEADRYAAGASEAEAYGYAPDEADVDDALATLDADSFEFERHDQEQPSDHVVPDTETDLLHASAPDILEQANTYASSTAADILSTIAQSASPPSGHYKDYEPISSTVYDDNDDDDAGYDIEDEEREQEQQISDTEHEQQAFEKEHEHPEQRDLFELTPERDNFEVLPAEATAAACFFKERTPELVKEPEPVTYAEPVLCTSSTDILAEKDSTPVAPSSGETAGGCSFLKSIDPRVKDLIYWRDVKRSGVVFGGLLVVLVALALLSIISVVAYLSLTALAVTFSFVIYKKVTGAVRKSTDGHPFSCLLDHEINLNEDKLKPVIQTVLRKVNAVVQELRHLFLIEDTVDSIKFGVLLWALTYIGSWFSDLALIITVIVLVFTVPKLYETYQVQIDNYVGLAKAQINTYLSIIQSKVPFLKRKEKAH